MNAPKITVLMPVYNAERSLNEAIDSILSQTFEDFEFLIIDDGSTDASISIVSAYDDPRIRFYRNEKNLGISETLNKGIGLASAELIARMDSDDYSYPDRLQKQFDYIVEHPKCALLSTWANIVTEDKEFIKLEEYTSNFFYFNLTFECWIYHPTVMYRKTAVQQVGMYSMPYSEDYDLWWRLSTQFEIGNLRQALVDYRISSTSLNLVMKKVEYEIANEENVLRNIRHYMGENFTLSKECLECLRHNFQPMIKKNSIAEVHKCLEILDAVTEKILLEKDNPNYNAESIMQARFYKRQFMLEELGKSLPKLKAFALLIQTNAWLTLYVLTIHSLRWRIKSTLKSLSFSF